MSNEQDAHQPDEPRSERSARPEDGARTEPALYFFPEDQITDSELRRILAEGPPPRRAWALSHLLRFAQWEDIWQYVTRDELRDEFEGIELPENLRSAWARMLKIDSAVPVG